MRRDYKALLLIILTFAFIITNGLLLFGTIDATQGDTPACEQLFKREYWKQRIAGRTTLILIRRKD